MHANMHIYMSLKLANTIVLKHDIYVCMGGIKRYLHYKSTHIKKPVISFIFMCECKIKYQKLLYAQMKRPINMHDFKSKHIQYHEKYKLFFIIRTSWIFVASTLKQINKNTCFAHYGKGIYIYRPYCSTILHYFTCEICSKYLFTSHINILN